MANMLVNKYAKAKTGLDFARNEFNFKGGHKTNFITGNIVPSINPIEVLPADTFDLSFAGVVRSAPLIAPLLDDVYIDVVAFWVPNRLVMTEFAQFLGENNTKAWTLKQDVDLPTINRVEITNPSLGVTANKAYFADHYLALHMGIRSQLSGKIPGTIAENGIVTLKPRGYALIYNEWWRDENIIDPILFSKESGNQNALDVSLFGLGFGKQRKAARLSDFWNKMLPAPQRGQDVPISILDDLIPVTTIDPSQVNLSYLNPDKKMMFAKNSGGVPTLVNDNTDGDYLPLGLMTNSPNPAVLGYDNGEVYAQGSMDSIVPANLAVDLSHASAVSVNQLRYAIMLQRFYEISARGGMREIEYYANFWGCTSSDARFMRSELLTQKRFRINISQVLNTAGSSDADTETTINSALGSTGAYSVTAIKGHLFAKTFTEYGYIHIQHCIRTQPSISTGVDRSNFKAKFFDHFLPVFDHIGEQAYYTIELADVVSPGDATDVFGYNEAWAEYRYQYSDTVGILAPGEALEYWTLSRKLINPVLNQAFIEQSDDEFDRALIFKTKGFESGNDAEGYAYLTTTYQWLIDFYVIGRMSRTMSKDSTPGIIGRI